MSLAFLGLTACGEAMKHAPPGYTPLDATNQASFPTSDSDPHPEKLNVVQGHDDMLDMDWADGQGYVHAGIKDVWSAMQSGDVVADRRELTSWKVIATNTDKTADFSFTLKSTTKQLSLDYIVGWREAISMGTKDEPTEVVARGDLIQSASVLGMDVMSLLSDSVVMTVVDDKTTSISMIRHRSSLQSSPADAAQYVNDLYNSIVAKVHGNPLPTFN